MSFPELHGSLDPSTTRGTSFGAAILSQYMHTMNVREGINF